VSRFDPIWRLLDGQLESGRFPGYVAAVRIRGDVELRAAGRAARDTRFRLASITKPMGAALALSLVQDGIVTLDDPIDRWLPEAAAPRVLVSPDAPLDRTEAAERPVAVRDLLALTSGWGAVFEQTPLQAAMRERGVYPPTLPAGMTGDGFAAALCGLPLAFQPGRGWLYESGFDLLGVLLARAAGQPLQALFAERIGRPGGMTSTTFGEDDRPSFARLGSGLVSTADDVFRFYAALADGGAPILRPASVALLTADALTLEQRRQAAPVVGPGASWGLGVGVDLEAAEPWMAPGRWGWSGGSGTTAWVDPVRGTVCVLLTTRPMSGPLDGPTAFWTAVAEAARE
jgi:CubicO group peptidase (beta-lactamase class C family)